MSTGKVVLGVIAGAATGALLGILYAPARGAITRRSICLKGEQGLDDLKDKFNEYIDKITDRFEKVKDDVNELVDEIKDKVEKVEKDQKDITNIEKK